MLCTRNRRIPQKRIFLLSLPFTLVSRIERFAELGAAHPGEYTRASEANRLRMSLHFAQVFALVVQAARNKHPDYTTFERLNDGVKCPVLARNRRPSRGFHAALLQRFRKDPVQSEEAGYRAARELLKTARRPTQQRGKSKR